MTPKQNRFEESNVRCHVRARLRVGAAACVAAFLLTGCAATIWDQVDPEYNRLLGTAQTECRGDEITGIWVTRTPGRIGMPPMRFTMLFRPDGTGRIRRDGKELGDFTWAYASNGTWKGTPGKTKPGMVGPDQKFLPFTVRYSGNSLLMDSPFYGGVFALGSVIQSHVIFVRAEDEAAMGTVLQKQY
jgi:hypothetical protein